jgi:hypothetical protein
VYVDIDAIAVTPSRQLLANNPSATSVFGDLRHPKQILDLPEVQTLLDVAAPLGLLLIAVLPFVSDDTEADDSEDVGRTGDTCGGVRYGRWRRAPHRRSVCTERSRIVVMACVDVARYAG